MKKGTVDRLLRNTNIFMEGREREVYKRAIQRDRRISRRRPCLESQRKGISGEAEDKEE